MKLSTGEKIVYAIFAVVLIMVNPPILQAVNNYAIAKPFTFGWPTLLVWLDFWYVVGTATFLIGVLKIKAWGKDYQKP
ncbi:hypothetical protein SDC9_135936 [bioreactor metagenome]|uniref:DUF3311 domain-containing protein n=1 Tax=bioreactor metagenome TaxID=1076179 RepID=A0A645DJT0_9ZZZZ|nr:hypothetical protein [Candidatus Pelethousia sp.]NCB30172.1 hypothetical protein [Clostridia bacterium]